jgi:hypothetical protein
MMNKMILTAAAAFALIAGAQAQSSQYGTVENFYQANVDVDNSQFAGRIVNPGYWLVNASRWAEIDSRWTDGGYVRLGISSWESDNALGGGVPLKDWALAYAKAIGADVVIYAVHDATDRYNYSAHDVGFYAKQSARRATPAPTANDATWPDGRILAHPEHCVNAVAVKVKPNDTLKMRGGPGTQFNAVAEIPANANDISAFDKDQVWDGDTWWWPVEWRGFRGYIGRSYLSIAH